MILDIEACNEDLQRDTMVKVKDIADGIDPALKVTVDQTTNYTDGRLPVLDLKVWIGEDVNKLIKVLHTHYMKEVASRMTIHQRSSHSASMKRNVLVNEMSRILRNCSEDLPKKEAEEHIEYANVRISKTIQDGSGHRGYEEAWCDDGRERQS